MYECRKKALTADVFAHEPKNFHFYFFYLIASDETYFDTGY